MKIATVIGARPQFIKAAAVSRVIRKYNNINEVIIHTGQHYDENMSAIFFEELDIPQPDYNLNVGSMRHGKQTAKMLERIEEVILKEKPDWLLTYGDTNSTIAGALAAAKIHIPVAHVEAGLRSFNRKMPEEINRIATDHISNLLFAPTKNAMQLLEKEGLKEKSLLSGDVMYDSVLYYSEKLNLQHQPKELGTIKNYYLGTIHRPENTDNIQRLKTIFEAFSEAEYPVVLPLHPRTRSLLKEVKYNKNVKIIEPVGYLSMLYLLKNSKKVLTDSGGLQKEAYFLKIPCITLRDQTEWIETLNGGWNFIVGADKRKIMKYLTFQDYGEIQNVFGDGNAAEKIIIKIINCY